MPTQHFAAEQASQMLRVVASGTVPVSLLPPKCNLQQIAVGELGIEAQLPDGSRLRWQWFVSGSELAHSLWSSCENHPEQPMLMRADLQSWTLADEDDPLVMLSDDERLQLEQLLQHLG